jgi:hypothetical protein
VKPVRYLRRELPLSLNVSVGYLADLRECNPGDPTVGREYAAIRRILKKHGIEGYEEPEQLDNGWCACVTPSNGIAFLQRFASYFPLDDDATADEWPVPGDDETMGNPLEDDMYEDAVSLLECHPFQHLILHSCRHGYWVPVDFPDVIFPGRRTGIDMLGSSVRLLKECDELAKLLRLPRGLKFDDPDLLDALNHRGRTKPRWKKYGIESYNLVMLRTACQVSLKTGAAVTIE